MEAMNCIVRCLAGSHLEYAQNQDTAYGMIKALESVFQRKTIGTKFYLKKKSLKCQDGRLLSDFFKEFDSFVRAYRSAGCKVDDMELVVDLLMTVP